MNDRSAMLRMFVVSVAASLVSMWLAQLIFAVPAALPSADRGPSQRMT